MPARWWVGLAVLGLHLVALWWWSRPITAARPAAALRHSTVRLLPLERPRPPPADTAVPRNRRTPEPTTAGAAESDRPRIPLLPRLPRRSAPARPLSPNGAETTPQAVPAPLPITQPPAGSEVAAAPNPAASSASRPEQAPLNLVLRPGWRSAPANDHRLQAPPATPEQRMGRALGAVTDRTEEVLADGSRRIREGGRCLIARPNRAATLFPFDGSASRLPRAIDSCD